MTTGVAVSLLNDRQDWDGFTKSVGYEDPRYKIERESAIVFSDYFLPRDPFPGSKYASLPAEAFDRPKGLHGYHFFTHSWIIPVKDEQEILDIYEKEYGFRIK